MREKDGEVLSVNLVAYPHRPGLVVMQPLIAETLSDLGIDVTSTLTGMDWSETSKIMNERTFDMLMWAQRAFSSVRRCALCFTSNGFETGATRSGSSAPSSAVTEVSTFDGVGRARAPR